MVATTHPRAQGVPDGDTARTRPVCARSSHSSCIGSERGWARDVPHVARMILSPDGSATPRTPSTFRTSARVARRGQLSPHLAYSRYSSRFGCGTSLAGGAPMSTTRRTEQHPRTAPESVWLAPIGESGAPPARTREVERPPLRAPSRARAHSSSAEREAEPSPIRGRAEIRSARPCAGSRPRIVRWLPWLCLAMAVLACAQAIRLANQTPLQPPHSVESLARSIVDPAVLESSTPGAGSASTR